MNMNEIDAREILVLRIRGIQEQHAKAHAALVNWGAWSRDRAGLFPSDGRVGIWDAFSRTEWDRDGYGDQVAEESRLEADDRRAERADKEPYDELQGYVLDQRMHGPGGLPSLVRVALRTAYVSREIPEFQFPKLSGCSSDDSFCERLESALVFVGRFA